MATSTKSKVRRGKKVESAAEAAVTDPTTWLVTRLRRYQTQYNDLKQSSKTIADFEKGFKTLMTEAAFASEDFGEVRAVIGYKRALKVTLLGQDPETVAKSRG